MLIYAQKPDASLVAGLRTWNKMGRKVKKGEKGIAILAPLYKKAEKTVVDPETGKEVLSTSYELRGFKTVYVFDLSQTEGKALPVETFAPALQGESDYETVKAFVETYCPVVEKELNANGMTDFERIYVKKSLSSLHKCKTLFHELSHFLLHKEADYSRNRKEFEAESCAYLVMKKLGLDTSAYSFKYLAVFSELSDKDFEKALETAVKTADRIFEEFTQFLRQTESKTA